MSPRAACRLETLGFEHIYDYVPGKVDWLARGLPTEGDHAAEPRVRDVLRDDVVACALTDRVGDVRERVHASPYDFALVLSADGVLLGRLRKAAAPDGDPHIPAEQVMEPGPSTVRADTPAETLLERLRQRDLTTAVVTTPEGTLLGLVRRSDLEAAAAASNADATPA
jgi:CBS domain-containing protein